MELNIMVNENGVKEAVVDYLKSHGFAHIIPEYPILGYIADFVATDEHELIAIECKGPGGKFQEALGQAQIYKRACDFVYLAIPNQGFKFTKIEENICRQDGIGVLQCHFDDNDTCTRAEIILKPSYDQSIADIEIRLEILNDLIFEKKGKGRDPQLKKIHRTCEVVWFVSQGFHNRQVLIEKILETSKINSPRTASMAIRMAQTLELIEEEAKQSYILTATGRYVACLLQAWSNQAITELAENPEFSESNSIQSQLLTIFRLKSFNFRFVREVYRVLEKQGALDENMALTKDQIMAASSHHRPSDIESIILSADYLEGVGLVKSIPRPKRYYLNKQVLFF
jgi:hypothetical protein